MTLSEALEQICNDEHGETKTPGELAALLDQSLGNPAGVRTSWPDSAPFLLREIGDRPGWSRFDYEGWPSYRQLAAAHYILRAAESLTDARDHNTKLTLISLGRQICKEVQRSWSLPSRPTNDWIV